MNTDYLKALVASAKGSEHLYEEQAAAMTFTLAFGEQLIKLVEAGQAMRDSLGVASYLTLAVGKTYRQAEVGDNKLAVESIDAWDAATKEDV